MLFRSNRGKRSLALDLKQPAARETFLKLAARADVVVENYRPGTMEHLGLGVELLKRHNPRLIYTSISGYGATGPWTSRRAYAPVVNAETGITMH